MTGRKNPGVQHAQETDLRAQMLWIGGDLAQCLRGRLEQDIVDHCLVLKGDDLDLLGHGEHDVEVGHVKQFRVAVLEPLSACESLALWTAFVTTRVIPDALMATFAASFDMSAESSSAATFDRVHGAPPRARQRRAMLITESRAEVAEHIRHFQPFAGHGTGPSGGRELPYGWHDDVECLQRTDRGAHLVGGDHEIPGRGGEIAMTEQQLNGT